MVILLAGLALLYLAGIWPKYWATHEGQHALVENLGGLLVISVALGALWELVGKRALANEVLEYVKISSNVHASGLVSLHDDYRDVDWEQLIRSVKRLDIFLVYGRTWRNNYLQDLRRIASDPAGRIRVFLPDPDDRATMDVFAYRFHTTPEEVANRILEAKDAYEELRTPGGASVEIYFQPGDRTFTFYIFDNVAVLTLYSHSRERSSVPALVCRNPGMLYSYIQSELRAIEGQSRLVELK